MMRRVGRLILLSSAFFTFSAASYASQGRLYTPKSKAVLAFAGKVRGVSSDRGAVEAGIREVELADFSLGNPDRIPEVQQMFMEIRAKSNSASAAERAAAMAIFGTLPAPLRVRIESAPDRDQEIVTILNELKSSIIRHARLYLTSLDEGSPREEELEGASQILKQAIELVKSRPSAGEIIGARIIAELRAINAEDDQQ